MADEEGAATESSGGPQTDSQQEPLPSDVDRFIDRVKVIFHEASKKNGEKIHVNAKGWSGQYTFYIDAERIGKMLEDLRQNSAPKVKEYLGLFKSCVSVSAVAPFVGEILDIEDQIIAVMKENCEREGVDIQILMATDILEEATYLLYVGSPRTLIGEAFHKDTSGNHIYIPGMMSRKKQCIPPLSEAVKRIKPQ